MFPQKLLKHLKFKHFVLFLVIMAVFKTLGLTNHFYEKSFKKDFHYPLDIPLGELIDNLKENVENNVECINSYPYEFIKSPEAKCSGDEKLRVVYLVKSDPDHFNRRTAIRNTWGFEKRFSDVEIRTFFVLGRRDEELQKVLDAEYAKFGDIIQGNFTDSYFNNTVKTMMGLKWVYNHCKKSKFYMLVDDDYYVSTKNVLRFLRNPTGYPEYLNVPVVHKKVKRQLDYELPDDVNLYAGYVFDSTPHRHIFSKWFVELDEYPYDRWPPYVTAGAVVLSQPALVTMYLASFYTQHFRFDDIYLGLLAYRTGIEPFHSPEFYYYKKHYIADKYKFTVASHGFYPTELLAVWTQQKMLGNA